MNHWLIMPIVLPAVLGPLLIMLGRIDQVLRCHSIVLLSASLQAAGIPDSSVTS